MSKSFKWIYLIVCFLVVLNTISSCGNNDLATGNRPPAPLKQPEKKDPINPAPTPKPTSSPKPSPTPVVSPTPTPSLKPSPTPVVSPTPTPSPLVVAQPFIFGNVKETSYSSTKLHNAFPLIPINRLIIKNTGDALVLRRTTVSLPGATLSFDEPVNLPSESETEIILGIETKVNSVRFYIDGETSGLEVRAADSRH